MDDFIRKCYEGKRQVAKSLTKGVCLCKGLSDFVSEATGTSELFKTTVREFTGADSASGLNHLSCKLMVEHRSTHPYMGRRVCDLIVARLDRASESGRREIKRIKWRK